MSFNKKDKAIIAASSLVGYCESFPIQFEYMSKDDAQMLQRWLNGFKERVRVASYAIDLAINETSDGKSK